MNTTTHTFNPENWVDDELTIKVTEFAGTFSFEMNEYTITLEDKAIYDDFEVYRVMIDGKFMGDKVAKYSKEAEWYCTDENGEMSRDAKHPAVAVAKFLSNTL